jgi:PHD/YefM family antitoxin component YafN of YafNO toxin-antitoxin module
MANKTKYLVDDRGEKVGVVLEIDQYKKMLEELEELESIRAFDRAKASGDPAILFQQATEEIERSRK